MVARPLSQMLAPALLALSTVLLAWSWLLRPERAMAWAFALLFIVLMAIVLFVTGRAGDGAARRSGSDQIRGSIVFAGGILVLSLGAKLAAVHGGLHDPDLSRRMAMVVTGVWLVFTGNALPKTLTPLASLRCDPARVQAFQRLAGWTWVLSGLAYVIAWLFLPISVAKPVTVTLLIGTILVIGGQLARLRWGRP